MSIFYLPDLGEGLPDAEIVEWHVAEGDAIEKDAPLVSMETAKAIVDVPSPNTGTVQKLHGQPGDIIPTGNPLVTFSAEPGAEMVAADKSTTVAGKIEEGNTVIADRAVIQSHKADGKIKASPAIRAIAKERNVDLSTVVGTGPNGAILAADLPPTAQAAPSAAKSIPEGYEQIKGTRRMMAQAMTLSGNTVVPVSIFDTQDISAWVKEGDITTRLVMAVIAAVKAEPTLNSWFDTASQSIKIHEDVNLGMAVDSPEGLFVPVLHEINKCDAAGIRSKINEFKQAARERSFDPKTLKGGTITLSNFGKFAGQFASPIVVPPTVAILGVGRLHDQVSLKNGSPVAAATLPLSLTFDHRAVTGGEATRFLGIIMKSLASA